MKNLIALFCTCFLAHAHTTTDLQVAHQSAPLGVDDKAPRLSWRSEGEGSGLAQSAYQILVSTSADLLKEGAADLWDSHKTDSSDSHAAYAGKALPSSTWIHWKVRTWSGDKASEWSPPQSFLTALIGSQPTQPYISFKDTSPFHTNQKKLYLPPARYYRSTFKPSKKITCAIAHASALGIYDIHVNGKRIGDSCFAPGWTNYRKRAYYNTYDLTPLLTDSDNAIGAVVADGWYAGYVGYGKLVGYGPNKTGRNIYGKTPALMVEIHVTYEDGSTEVIGTDANWKTTTGPELEADFLMGETYDARKEISGWATASFDDSKWEAAILAKDNGSVTQTFIDKFTKEKREFGFIRPPVLQAYPAQPVRAIEELAAKSVRNLKPGTWVFDLGQNIAGNIRLKVKAKSGETFVLRFAEMLHPDGSIMTENLRQARSTDTYIAKGATEGEMWTPRFTFHGTAWSDSIETGRGRVKYPLSREAPAFGVSGLPKPLDIRIIRLDEPIRPSVLCANSTVVLHPCR